MCLKTLRRIAVLIAGGAALLTVSGCTGNITSDTTIAEALAQLSQTPGVADTLNRLTVGDLVAGFQQFTGQLGPTERMPAFAGMTPEQQRRLEDLQGRVDRGEITQEEFASQVHNVIGDAVPGHAFGGLGFLGGPVRHGPRFQMAEPLDLSDEQREQAQDIFERLHEDIRALRQQAHEKMLAVLTPDQQTMLTELIPDRPERADGGGWGMHGREVRMGMGRGVGPQAGGLRPFFQDLADELQLTEDQKAQIEQIRADLRAAVEARHRAARDEFRAILTVDQLAILDELEAERPPPVRGGI